MSTIAEPTATTVLPSGASIPERAWPRIALVTPVFNSVKYVEPTIRSVLMQDYPNLDYFIVDGGSTDGTIDIIRKYENQISGWVSEPDNGMYDAINKGFARTTGEIMGWISATDMLHVGGLKAVGSVFRDLPEVEWITSLPSGFTDEGMVNWVSSDPRRWARLRFLAGANRHIMQEGTFWRRSLWDRAGGYVDASRRYVSDFELWVRFFRHAKLFPVRALIAGYRTHPDALGLVELELCRRIQEGIIEAELETAPYGKQLRLFRALWKYARKISGLRYLSWRLVEKPLYLLSAKDWPPLIQFDVARNQWVYREE
jgi:glycosyltransferase involved in cell wall biosynthesis